MATLITSCTCAVQGCQGEPCETAIPLCLIHGNQIWNATIADAVASNAFGTGYMMYTNVFVPAIDVAFAKIDRAGLCPYIITERRLGELRSASRAV